MIYTANISTAKDTAVTALKRTNITVTKGLVYKVEFYFPAGSAGLMGLAVSDGLYQVWPSSVGEFFIGEAQVISFDDMYLKESAPYNFQCYTYNTDDTHAHSLSVRIGLVSKEVFLARFMPTRGTKYLEELLEFMVKEKEISIRVQKEQLPMTPKEWLEEHVEPPSEPTEPVVEKIPEFGIQPVQPIPIIKQPDTGPKIPEFGVDSFRQT